jgi:PPOX class probable F420-dependent enzyme
MNVSLPATFKKLVDERAFVIVGTVNPDGSPQTSLLWAAYDGDDILLSTITSRAKYRNWQRDPRASVLVFDPKDAYSYVEVRGRVGMTTDGGPELIERLSQIYEGTTYTGDEGTDHVRVVARVTPEHVHER